MQKSEPKTCPFCDECPTVKPWHGGGPRKRAVFCNSGYCYVRPMVTGWSRSEAVRRWNLREGS